MVSSVGMFSVLEPHLISRWIQVQLTLLANLPIRIRGFSKSLAFVVVVLVSFIATRVIEP